MDAFYQKPSLRKKLLSLKILVPGSLLIAFLIITVISLLMSLWQGTDVLRQRSQQFVQREIARLSHLAEGTTRHAPQLLEDSITHLSTDPLVKSIAVLKPNNTVLYSSDFSWRGEAAARILPEGTLKSIQRAKQSRQAIVKYDVNKRVFTTIISFTYPSGQAEIRSQEKGIVYISYDISGSLSQSRLSAISDRLAEILSMLFVTLLLAELLRRYVVRPLESITSAARSIASGDFASSIRPVGPVEIQTLTKRFNEMNNKLEETVRTLDLKTEQTQGILDNTFDGIITIDQSGNVISFNKTAETIFKTTTSEVIGKNVKVLMPEYYKQEHDSYIHNYLNSSSAKIIGIGREVMGQRSDGTIFPMDLAVTEVKSNDESLFVGIIRDITERKEKELEIIKTQENLARANKKLQEMVGTDGLTDIANRRRFDEMLQTEFNRAMRQGYDLSLIMFDVDYFKKYNDHYGHLEGDQCLKKIAQTAKQLFQRNGELVARYGGEEFAVILPNNDIYHAEKSAKALLERIQDLNIPHVKSVISDHITVSIGVASIIPDRQHSIQEFIEITDSALYQAKENGRSQVATFSEECHAVCSKAGHKK